MKSRGLSFLFFFFLPLKRFEGEREREKEPRCCWAMRMRALQLQAAGEPIITYLAWYGNAKWYAGNGIPGNGPPPP
jgi:hypothetical protein